MNYARYQKLLSVMIKRKNIFLLFSISLLIITLIEGLVILKTINNVRIVVVPTQLSSPAVFDNRGVSPSLIADLTRYAADLFLNASPDNTEYRTMQILKMTASQSNAAIKENLLAQNDMLVKNKASTVFYPKNVVPDNRALSATISGQLDIYIGSTLTQSIPKTYQVQYTYQSGNLLIIAFNEVNKK